MPRTLVHRIRLSHSSTTARRVAGQQVMKLARRQGLAPVWGKGGLSHSISIYVPSTKRKVIPISSRAFGKRVHFTEDFVSRLFGGETTTFGRGSFYSPSKHRVVRERIAIVRAAASPSDLRKYKLKLNEFARREKRAWGQESLSVSQDSKLFFV